MSIKGHNLEDDCPEDKRLENVVEVLKSLVETVMKTKLEDEEKEKCRKEKENLFKADLICIDNINDEHLKLEVSLSSVYIPITIIPQAKLHNSEIVLEKYKYKFDDQTKSIKSKETKITELSCKVNFEIIWKS